MSIKKYDYEHLMDNKFLNVYDYKGKEDGSHYFVASRRKESDLVSEQDVKTVTPDAVTCFVIVNDTTNDKSYLLVQDEFRKPVNATLLSVPAGLIDDKGDRDTVIKETALREIWEETGIDVNDAKVNIVSPCVFGSPGLTDECTAFVSVIIDVENIEDLNLTNSNTVGGEQIGGHRLVDHKETMKLLKDSAFQFGNPMPMQTFTALMYFQSNMWEENTNEYDR